MSGARGTGAGEPRWSGTPDRAARYAARFAALAAGGADVHGEAAFCAERLDPGARVLDAGCGTGRVAIRLAELGWDGTGWDGTGWDGTGWDGTGWDCTGVDNDPHMLAQAQAASTTVRWVLGDLATPDLGGVDGPFDLVVAAGNVIALVAPGTEAVVLANLAAALRPSGVLVAGFGLDAAHLPLPAAPFGLVEYDAWCAAAGLTLVQRCAGWDGSAYDGGGYAVSVHCRVV